MAKEVEYRIIGEQQAEDGSLIRIVEPVVKQEEKPKKKERKGVLASMADKWDSMTGGQKLVTVVCGAGILYSGYRILGDMGFVGGGNRGLTAGSDDINIDVSGYLD